MLPCKLQVFNLNKRCRFKELNFVCVNVSYGFKDVPVYKEKGLLAQGNMINYSDTRDIVHVSLKHSNPPR